jgi:uncharacterized protein DUF3352
VRLRRAWETLDNRLYRLRRWLRLRTRGATRPWFRLPPRVRQVLAAVGIAAAGYGLIRVAPLPGAPELPLPCEYALGTKTCPAVDQAVRIVPEDALLYAHISTDREGDQFERARELAAELPNFGLIERTVLDALPVPSGRRLDPGRDLGAWAGDELAVAVVEGRKRSRGTALLVEASDAKRARAFADLIAPAPARGEPDMAGLRHHGPAFADSVTGGFLIAGDPVSVRRIIRVAKGDAASLAGADQARRVRGPLPDNRLADIYVSEVGVRRLLAGRGGFIGQLDTFVNVGATGGIAASLKLRDDGPRLTLHSAIDPERARAHPGFLDAFSSFEPGLTDDVAEGAFAYFGIADAERAMGGLLKGRSGLGAGLGDALRAFAQRLRRRDRVDLAGDVLPLLAGEAALFAEQSGPLPVITLIVDDVDEQKARQALAKLQLPIVRALEPSRDIQAPSFEVRKIAGVEASVVRLNPAVTLTYALSGGRLIASTAPAGLQRALEGGGLDDAELFAKTLSHAPDRPAALVFLDLARLLALAEPAGLAEDPLYATFREDLRKLPALGFSVARDDHGLTADLSLAVE